MILSFETDLIKLLQSSLSFFVIPAHIITYLGEESVIILVLSFVYWCFDKETGRKLAQNLIFGLCLNTMIKNIFTRSRPYITDPGIKCLKPVRNNADIFDVNVQGHSFPSGHASNSVTLYTSLAIYKKKRLFSVSGFLIPLFVGFSRVILGVHYPTDVLAGFLLGLAVILVLDTARRYIKDLRLLYAILILISFCGIFFCRTSDYYSSLGILIGFCSGDIFEKEKVSFETPKKTFHIILRPVLGILAFMLVNYLIKSCIALLLSQPSQTIENLIRIIRYSFTVFVLIGLYPMLFKKFKF